MAFTPPGILGRIIENKRQDLVQLSRDLDPTLLQQGLAEAPPPLDFAAALQINGRVPIIAELKRRSPSAGRLISQADAGQRALTYRDGGAAALSILTDSRYFGGSIQDLTQARQAAGLPVLCKDFIVDPLQLLLARSAGADAVLLIAAALEPLQLADLFGRARELELTPLVEVHQAAELEAVLGLDPPLVGINNRDLVSLEVDINQCLRIRPLIPPGPLVVAESGINSGRDVRRLRDAGLDAFLVGGALMTAEDPAALLGEMVSAGGE